MHAMTAQTKQAALLVLAALATCHVAAEAGRMRVLDGDTLGVGTARVRLWGIDAPELRQGCTRDGKAYACGSKAREALTRLIRGQDMTCEAVDRDRYRRTVARCTVGGEDLGGLLVRAGWALDYRRYSKGRYTTDQAMAKASRAGLWAGTFELPWRWRSLHKRGNR